MAVGEVWNISGWAQNFLSQEIAKSTHAQQQGVQFIYSTSTTFAANKVDGSVVALGTADVQRIYSTSRAFAANRVDGSVVALGTADVQRIYTTAFFAASKADDILAKSKV